jgi:hypothetical protein
MAEGGETSPHRENYVETILNRGDGLLTEFVKFAYNKHDIIVLSWPERRVSRRSRYEKVCLIEEGNITAKTRKEWSL